MKIAHFRGGQNWQKCNNLVRKKHICYVYLNILWICIMCVRKDSTILWECKSVCERIPLGLYVCIYICICKCIRISICICIYVCIGIWMNMYVYMYVHMHMYIYINNNINIRTNYHIHIYNLSIYIYMFGMWYVIIGKCMWCMVCEYDICYVYLYNFLYFIFIYKCASAC